MRPSCVGARSVLGMTSQLDRRAFLKYSAAAATGATAAAMVGSVAPARAASNPTSAVDPPFRWNEQTIAQLQAAMESGEATALSLTRDYLDRIERVDWSGPQINSIIEVNPDAEAIARALDQERLDGHVRGPLHGIPVVLKDVVATADRMETTAGSLALVGSKVPRDAGIVRFLRDAGAIMLGKANLSEWNAFRGFPSLGGWSGRAGIGLNPYALNFSTGDSSSGSAAAVAANLAAGAVGLETYGSIVMPSSLCGVVGLKPTRGLISRSGTIPISFSRDATGPIARRVSDVAALLNGMVGVDPRDPITRTSRGRVPNDYTRFLEPRGGLRGARIGVWRRPDLWDGSPSLWDGIGNPDVEASGKVIESVLPVFEELGATLVDPVHWPHWLNATGDHIGVMFSEFRHGINRYLAELTNTDMRTLDDVVAFNEAHPREELRWHNDALLRGSVKGGTDVTALNDPEYLRAMRDSERVAREGFHQTMRRHRLDVIVAPTFVRAWPINLLDADPYRGNGVAGPSNAAGYPNLTVPAGFAHGLPIGISFLGGAWEEPKLIRYASAFEHAVQARRAPKFLPDREFVER